MWTDASRLNQSKFTYVNAVIIKAVECNVFKKTNFFCDVIKGRSSSTCGPRKISTSFPGNLHFFKPWLWHYQERDLHSYHSFFKTQMMQMPWTTSTGTNIILNFLEKNTTVRASLKTQIGSCDANAQQHQVEVTYPSELENMRRTNMAQVSQLGTLLGMLSKNSFFANVHCRCRSALTFCLRLRCA